MHSIIKTYDGPRRLRIKLSTMRYKIERQYLREYYSNLLEEDDIDEDC